MEFQTRLFARGLGCGTHNKPSSRVPCVSDNLSVQLQSLELKSGRTLNNDARTKLIDNEIIQATVQMFSYHCCHSFMSKETVYYFVSMAPHTTFSVRKFFLRFFQRGKTQREVADLTDTSKSSVNRTIVNFKKLAA